LAFDIAVKTVGSFAGVGKMKINVKALAFACSVLWGSAVFIVTWWVIILDGASGNPTWLGNIYLGYELSVAGSFIGLGWGLVDGFIGGAVLAWLYNKFSGA
jgi:hypothetical protein